MARSTQTREHRHHRPLSIDEKTKRLRAARLAEEAKLKSLNPSPVRQDHPDRIYEFRDIMPFGKHKGKMIEIIMAEDLSYITWLLENVASFHLSDEAETIYLELTDPRRK